MGFDASKIHPDLGNQNVIRKTHFSALDENEQRFVNETRIVLKSLVRVLFNEVYEMMVCVKSNKDLSDAVTGNLSFIPEKKFGVSLETKVRHSTEKVLPTCMVKYQTDDSTNTYIFEWDENSKSNDFNFIVKIQNKTTFRSVNVENKNEVGV